MVMNQSSCSIQELCHVSVEEKSYIDATPVPNIMKDQTEDSYAIGFSFDTDLSDDGTELSPSSSLCETMSINSLTIDEMVPLELPDDTEINPSFTLRSRSMSLSALPIINESSQSTSFTKADQKMPSGLNNNIDRSMCSSLRRCSMSELPADTESTLSPSLRRRSMSMNELTIPPSILKKTSSSRSISNEPSPMKRTVSFNTISIRQYEIEIADHPGITGGPPIGLGWDYTSEDSYEFSTYEFERKPRRNHNQLYMPKAQRKFILKRNAGFSDQEIKQASKQAKNYRRNRVITQTLMPVFETKEVLCSAKRYLSRRFNSSPDLTTLSE